MFKKIFGGGFNLDKPTLAKWLAGSDVRRVMKYQEGLSAALLETLDESSIVEENASVEDLSGTGAELIKGSIMQLLQGGPDRLGFTKKDLTPGQDRAAHRIYDMITSKTYGELFAAALSAATIYAMVPWYVGKYTDSIALATHILEHLEATNGEAYRIRAFAYIMLGDLQSARDDLRSSIRVMPTISGAKEPLAAVEHKMRER